MSAHRRGGRALRTMLLLGIALSAACTPGTPSPTVQPTVFPATATAPLPTIVPTALATETTRPLPTPTRAAVAEKEIAVGERSIGDPYTPELGNTGYDVQRYTLRLALDPVQVQVTGSATLEATSTLEGLGELSLDFIGYEISALTVDGEAASYQREQDKLVVHLPEPLSQGQAFSIMVDYAGAPVEQPSRYVPFIDHLGLIFQPEQNNLFAVNEPDGARYWFPCNDHPRDKAAFRVELTVPEEMTGVSNGRLVETQTEIPNAFPDGRAGDRFIWEHAGPMATYLATVAVGEYVPIEDQSPDGVPLRSYIFPDSQEEYRALQPLVGDAIDWMGERFGPYPFEAFGYVQVNGLGASLETQTMVVLGSFDPGTMIHEMSHMWFGDWVSLDTWGDIWRNEGFATYTTVMWEAEQGQGASIDEQVAQWEAVFEDQAGQPLNNPPPEAMFDSAIYYRGALLAHQLREQMGDEAFLAGLKRYLQRHGGSTATHEQFQAVLEEASGTGLEDLFQEWLEDG